MEELAISFSAVRHKNTCSRRCFFVPPAKDIQQTRTSKAAQRFLTAKAFRGTHMQRKAADQRTDRAGTPEAHAGKPPLNTTFF